MDHEPHEYEQICASCWEADPTGGWSRHNFLMQVGLTERRLVVRSLCPACDESFTSDEARSAFLATTLPSRVILLASGPAQKLKPS